MFWCEKKDEAATLCLPPKVRLFNFLWKMSRGHGYVERFFKRILKLVTILMKFFLFIFFCSLKVPIINSSKSRSPSRFHHTVINSIFTYLISSHTYLNMSSCVRESLVQVTNVMFALHTNFQPGFLFLFLMLRSPYCCKVMSVCWEE